MPSVRHTVQLTGVAQATGHTYNLGSLRAGLFRPPSPCHSRRTAPSRLAPQKAVARGIRFCRTFLHVARVKKSTQFSHGRRFFDSSNVQKCVTQITYLGPLPTPQWPGQLWPWRQQSMQDSLPADDRKIYDIPQARCLCCLSV